VVLGSLVICVLNVGFFIVLLEICIVSVSSVTSEKGRKDGGKCSVRIIIANNDSISVNIKYKRSNILGGKHPWISLQNVIHTISSFYYTIRILR